MGHSFGLLDFVHFLIVTDLQCVIRRRQIWYLLQYSSPSLPRAQTLPRPHPLSRVASGILLVRKADTQQITYLGQQIIAWKNL